MSRTRPIRILMLLENYSFPEDSRVRLQARTLTQAGYQVTVIAPTGDGTVRKVELVEEIRVYRYPAPPEFGGVVGYSIEYAYSIGCQFLLAWWVLLRHGFDTIHMHTPPDMNAVIPVFFRLLGKKFIYDLHDLSPELYLAQKPGRQAGILSWALLRFERFASRWSHLSISTNETQRDVHVARCGVAKGKFHVVRNGPNESFLCPQIAPRRVVNRDGAVVLGYVGVMGTQDGVDYLIEAVHRLVKKRGRHQVQAVLVGSGPAVEGLQRQAAELGIADFVHFTGKVPFAEVPEYIAGFDICCTPDPSNPYNDSCTTIKTMEYMALGKPVVCFKTKENMETAGDAALYAENNDLEDYVDQIEALIDSPQLRQSMGEIGRRRIVEELAWTHQADRLVAAYDQLHRLPGRTGPTEPPSAKLNPESGAPPLAGLPMHFAFNGPLGRVLREFYERDVALSKLNWKFRLYYRIRPWLPLAIRQAMQKSRNRHSPKNPEWYVPEAFLRALRAARLEPTVGDAAASPTHVEDNLIIHPWPNGHRFAVCLTHDIETAQGLSRVRRIAEIEAEFGIRSAWYVVPHAYQLDLGLLRELQACGHEVGIHGYNHDGRLFSSRAIFNRRVGPINSAGRQFQASGFRAPMVHRNLEWMQALDFDYDASCFDIDPFQAMPGGVGGVWPFLVGKLVELPYTLPQDHTLMLTLGQPACEVWIRKLTLIKQLSGLAMLITHPDYLDSPQRQDEYRRFCERVAGEQEKWLALPRDIATWWRERQASPLQADGVIRGPAANRGRVVRLGSLFEV